MILKLNNNNGKSVILRVRVIIHRTDQIKNVVDVTFAMKFGTCLMYVMHLSLKATNCCKTFPYKT